jgi:hypothetical protein
MNQPRSGPRDHELNKYSVLLGFFVTNINWQITPGAGPRTPLAAEASADLQMVSK